MYVYSKSTKPSTGINYTKVKIVVTFGDEGRRRDGNGIGVGVSSICNVLFGGKSRVFQRHYDKILKSV